MWDEEHADCAAVVNVEVGGLSGTNHGKPTSETQAICSRLNELLRTYVLQPSAHLFSRSADAWNSTELVQNWEELSVAVDEEGGAHSALQWYLACDIYCIDNDGCLFDACLAGLVAAMRNSAHLLPPSRPSAGLILAQRSCHMWK